MGMEIVSVIMATEEAFDIGIPDRDAESLGTVQELALYVAQRVPRRSGEGCRTQRAFHQVRRVLRRLHISRAALAPHADLYTLMPVLAHPNVWPLLGKELGVSQWPTLPKSYPWRKLTPTTILPYGLRTPGEMARHVATCQFERTTGPWTWEEILLRTRQIVTESLEEVSFSDNAHFINELGVG